MDITETIQTFLTNTRENRIILFENQNTDQIGQIKNLVERIIHAQELPFELIVEQDTLIAVKVKRTPCGNKVNTFCEKCRSFHWGDLSHMSDPARRKFKCDIIVAHMKSKKSEQKEVQDNDAEQHLQKESKSPSPVIPL